MIDAKTIEIEGLNALRIKLIDESKQILKDLDGFNVLAYNRLEKLIELKKQYDYVESRLNVLDPKRNDVPF